MKFAAPFLAFLLLICPASAFADALITEITYNTCNDSPLGDGVRTNSGEYVIITNTGTSALDFTGWELDDDGVFTDGDGYIFGTFSLAASRSVVVAGTTQLLWEAEYGSLDAGLDFINASGDMQAFNNTGDNLGFGHSSGNALNNGAYTNVADQGEAAIWNGTAWVNGGVSSTNLIHGGQTYSPGSNALNFIAVPEPGSCLLLGVCLIGFGTRRDRELDSTDR